MSGAKALVTYCRNLRRHRPRFSLIYIAHRPGYRASCYRLKTIDSPSSVTIAVVLSDLLHFDLSRICLYAAPGATEKHAYTCQLG
jgi:hypothetical protein